jgi:phosphoesterase RecJ-like protein
VEQLIEQLIRALESPKRILITNHQGPDGDAMGAALALYRFLTKMGHRAAVVTPNDYPDFLHWMPGNEVVLNFMRQKQEALDWVRNSEYIFLLDYNQLKRSGDMHRSLTNAKGIRVLIDHHLEPNVKTDYLFSDTNSSSTCELLFRLMKRWNSSIIDREIATCIYTGVMTDTGCFCHRNATPDTFRLAAELMGYGIDRNAIYDLVFDNFSAQRMRLMGYCLNEKLEVFPDYGTALISLNRAEQQRFDFVVGDSEGFVNLPLSIKGVRFAAFFLEKEDKIKISFRSKGEFSVNEFARRHFHGGGHLNAAGGETRSSLDEALQLFRNLLPAYQSVLQRPVFAAV